MFDAMKQLGADNSKCIRKAEIQYFGWSLEETLFMERFSRSPNYNSSLCTHCIGHNALAVANRFAYGHWFERGFLVLVLHVFRGLAGNTCSCHCHSNVRRVTSISVYIVYELIILSKDGFVCC